MNLKRRLEDLEGRLGAGRGSVEDAVSREVIRRMSTEELKEYTDALNHLRDMGKPSEEDTPI